MLHQLSASAWFYATVSTISKPNMRENISVFDPIVKQTSSLQVQKIPHTEKEIETKHSFVLKIPMNHQCLHILYQFGLITMEICKRITRRNKTYHCCYHCTTFCRLNSRISNSHTLTCSLLHCIESSYLISWCNEGLTLEI